jgi:hypothetical protein
MDMPEDLEPKGLPVNGIPDCYGGMCSEEDYTNCSYAELCREQKEWDDADDCDGGDFPTGELCIFCDPQRIKACEESLTVGMEKELDNSLREI